MSALGGVKYGAELSTVNFSDNKYSDYNYVYAGVSGGGSLDAQVNFSASAGGSIFVAYDTNKTTDPSTFSGAFYSLNVSADIKQVVGGGISISAFSGTEDISKPGWKGISLGISIGAGESVNLGSVGLQRSESILLNDVKLIVKRGIFDRIMNKVMPIQSSIANFLRNKLK